MLDIADNSTSSITVDYEFITSQQDSHFEAQLKQILHNTSRVDLNCKNIIQFRSQDVQLLLWFKQLLNNLDCQLNIVNLTSAARVYLELVQADKLLLPQICQGVAA